MCGCPCLSGHLAWCHIGRRSPLHPLFPPFGTPSSARPRLSLLGALSGLHGLRPLQARTPFLPWGNTPGRGTLRLIVKALATALGDISPAVVRVPLRPAWAVARLALGGQQLGSMGRGGALARNACAHAGSGGVLRGARPWPCPPRRNCLAPGRSSSSSGLLFLWGVVALPSPGHLEWPA